MVHPRKKSTKSGGAGPSAGSADDGDGDVGPAPRVQAWVASRYSVFDAKKNRLVLQAPDPQAYLTALRQWRALRGVLRHPPKKGSLPPTPPVPAPGVNWVPIGPSVIRRGQAIGSPPVSGRAVDVAIAPGGSRVYVATANGGVWRSDDGGSSWASLMDSVDLAPTYVDSDSQACGAIAIDPNNPDRVYVGTGEGESSHFFSNAFPPLGVIYAYAGVGVLRSDSGGLQGWVTEPVTPGSPSLVGQAFFALAVDPNDSERVVGATTAGIYRREPDGSGGYQWTQTQTGNCTSVCVATAGGTTTWFAALRFGTMLTSQDGASWSPLGTGFPNNVSRVSLAVQPGNPNTIYAFSSAGIHRLDVANGAWLLVTNAIAVDNGDYAAAITVDPTNVSQIYIGADGSPQGHSDANIQRVIVSATGSGPSLAYSAALTVIGDTVHVDVHRVVLRSDAPDELWVATDGGVFQTTTASTSATFRAPNVGLATALCTYLDNHPTEAGVIFCGAQDNGTLRYTGEEAWLHSGSGDGGPVVINWRDPYQIVRTYIWGGLEKAIDGGEGPGSWTDVSPSSGGALFYPPLAGAPVDPSNPATADRLAMGAGVTWFSDDFAATWTTPGPAFIDSVSALAFTTADRVYAGTTGGVVWLYTRSSSGWAAGTLVGAVGGAGTTGIGPIVTSIIADPADSTGTSFYLTLGGVGDWRRVWHYDGTTWTARSGPSAGASTSLLAINFNTIAADPVNPSTLFAGADIGVWRSTDGGSSWVPYAEGLPEAGISHLKLHPTRRLLRAATYGRGVYERDIDATSATAIELYVKDTDLDVARWPTVDWLNDPESGVVPHAPVLHWESTNIKVDPPSSSGTYQTSRTIDFFQFVDQLVDGSDGVATVDASAGTAINRVFIEVHNRGLTRADGVQVMLLLANASAGLNANPLPMGYTNNVQLGRAVSNGSWQTVGIQPVDGLLVGFPKIVEFGLSSTILPPPTSLPAQSHYCLLAILHHSHDPFTSTERNADNLTIADRKVAQRNLQIVSFTGTLPPPGQGSDPLSPQSTLLNLYASGEEADLVLDLGSAQGGVTLLLPRAVEVNRQAGNILGGELLAPGSLDAAVKRQLAIAESTLRESRASAEWTRAAISRLRGLLGGQPIRFTARAKSSYVGIKNWSLSQPTTGLLLLEPPAGAKLGDTWRLVVMLAATKGGRILGGSTYLCRVVLPPDDQKSVQIHVRAEREGAVKKLLVRPVVRGKPVMDEGEVFAAEFTALGLAGPPKKLVWNRARESFVLELPTDSSGTPPVRRLTFVARTTGLEGRRTVDAD